MPSGVCRSLKEARKMIAQRKRIGKAKFIEGFALFKNDKYQEATRGLSIASDHGFEKLDSDFLLGVCYLILGKLEAAKSCLYGALQQAKSAKKDDYVLEIEKFLSLIPDNDDYEEPSLPYDSQTA
jgi:hypothetical protein